jgi:hypothetical protein
MRVDGAEDELDLRAELDDPSLVLKKHRLLQAFRIDPDFHTLVWPNRPILR